MLDHSVFDSAAYRTLKPGPRALLWELQRRFNGSNNGRIVLSQSDAAKALRLSDRATVAKYFDELERHGFIRVGKRGGFNMKDPTDSRATEWTLTFERMNDNPPTRDYCRWKPEP